MAELVDMDYTDLVALRDRVVAEVQRRDTLAAVDAQLERLAEDVDRAEGREDGAPWEQPVTLGYPRSRVTLLSGAHYRSLVPNNVWRPGDEAAHGVWERVWPDGAGGWLTKDPTQSGPRPWVVDMQVAVGDLVVLDGWVWSAKLAHRTHLGWRPSDAAYAVWAKVRAA